MAIENVYEPDRYMGDGTQTVFPVSFAFHDVSWLRVTLTSGGADVPLANGTDFTGAIAPGGVGGSVTLAAAPANGATVTVWMDVPRTQPAVLPSTGHFDLKGLERMLDRTTLQIQQLAEGVARAVKTAVTSTTTPDQIMTDINTARVDAQASAAGAAASENAAADSAGAAAASAGQSSGSATDAADAAAQGVANMEAIRLATLSAVAGASVPVGAEFLWFADPADPTGNIPAGYVLGMGEELSRATYPDLWAWVVGTGRLITEAAWQAAYAANDGNVGYYSDGDGVTTFRVPRIVRYVSGGEIAEAGSYLGDASRAITSNFGGGYIRLDTAGTITGALTTDGVLRNVGTSTTGNTQCLTGFDSSQSVPTADENRPKTIKRTFIIKAFSAAVNTGSVDVEQLATDVAGMQAGYAGRVLRTRSYTATGTFTTTATLAAGGTPTESSGAPIITQEITTDSPCDLVIEAGVPWFHNTDSSSRGIVVILVLDGEAVSWCTDSLYRSGATYNGHTAVATAIVPGVPAGVHTVEVRFIGSGSGVTITVNPANMAAGLKTTLRVTEVQ